MEYYLIICHALDCLGVHFLFSQKPQEVQQFSNLPKVIVNMQQGLDYSTQLSNVNDYNFSTVPHFLKHVRQFIKKGNKKNFYRTLKTIFHIHTITYPTALITSVLGSTFARPLKNVTYLSLKCKNSKVYKISSYPNYGLKSFKIFLVIDKYHGSSGETK